MELYIALFLVFVFCFIVYEVYHLTVEVDLIYGIVIQYVNGTLRDEPKTLAINNHMSRYKHVDERGLRFIFACESTKLKVRYLNNLKKEIEC